MKKKLFVWYYLHNGHVCGLTEDGIMIAVITHGMGDFSEEASIKIKKDFFLNNSIITIEYDVIDIDQKSLKEHMYDGGPRSLLREDFRNAWDKYKVFENPTVN